ncbi:hypothetical protein SAMN05421812_109189 [Asanoa hainanensis]|uniref:Uncharacterized protein n=1 Tax=Asanoa hainanensis TaxID=560556 RepID=A0A239NLJ4_9ACTN|nr:hypothetical protein [Asanoa hainanensis]SNT55218.1 hypothetical protein SAMN05421812_109189 [Asanoa hainanensis]
MVRVGDLVLSSSIETVLDLACGHDPSRGGLALSTRIEAVLDVH